MPLIHGRAGDRDESWSGCALECLHPNLVDHAGRHVPRLYVAADWLFGALRQRFIFTVLVFGGLAIALAQGWSWLTQ